jgi:hypothetical protein
VNIAVSFGEQTSEYAPRLEEDCTIPVEVEDMVVIGGGSGEETPTQTKQVDIVANGSYTVVPDRGYTLSKVTANVSVPSDKKPEQTASITIEENGTVEVTPDSGKVLSKVIVTVAVLSGGGAPTTIGDVNLHNPTTDIKNTYLQGGTLKPYNAWKTTDFIPVEEGKLYLAYSTDILDAKYCSKFNANKGGATSLSGVINCTNKQRPVFLTGHNGYFRFSGSNSQIAALEFYEVINFNWQVPN